MKTKKIYFFFLLLLSWNVAQAQKAPIKWGKLLDKDTSMTVFSSSPEASAVVLCDFGTVEVGPRTEYTRHVRIKILKEDGLKYANVEIPYRFYEYYDDFSNLKAQTMNIGPNGSIVKTKVKGKDIEDVQIDKYNKKKFFKFPDVKVGSIVEYTYTLQSLDLVKLRDWYFQTSIPVIWSEYRVYIPRRFNYLVTFQKGMPLDFEEQKGFAEKMQWLYNTRLKKAQRELSNQKYVLYESPKGTIKVYYAQGESYTFVMKNMPAFDPKKAVYSLNDYYPAVKTHLYIAEGNFPFYYRRILANAKEDFDWDNSRAAYRNSFIGYIAYWLPTWDEAAKQWLKSELLGNRLIKAYDFKPILDKTVVANDAEINTTKKLFQYVKENIQWNGAYSMYAYREFNEVLKKKSGSSGEINLLLISLLQKAGIKATPVLIRTRDIGRIENVYPAFRQFNHIIAQVETDGKTLYLDVTGSFDQLPWNVNKSIGFLLLKENYKWVDIVGDQKIAAPVDVKEM